MRQLAARGLAIPLPSFSEGPGRPGERYAFAPRATRMGCLVMERVGIVTYGRVDLSSVVTAVRTINVADQDRDPGWRSAALDLLTGEALDVLVVAMPGLVTGEGDVVRVNAAPSWAGFNLRELLNLDPTLQLGAENHVNVAALAESRVGAGSGLGNQIYLHIAQGLKAGIVIDGELLRGASFAAGEGPNLAHPAWSFDPTESNAALLVDRLVGLVAAPLAQMIGTIDPELIVLGGPGADHGGPKLRKQLAAAVGAHLAARAEPEIRLGELGAEAALLGAAIRAVELGSAAILDGEAVAPQPPTIERTPS